MSSHRWPGLVAVPVLRCGPTDVELAPVLAVRSPGQEVPDIVGGRAGGQPGLHVALAAGCQGEVVLAEPGQEGGHGADLVPGLAGGGARAGADPGTVPQAPQDPPGQVGLHDPPVGGVINAGEDVPAPSFHPGQCLVAGGKDTAGDQHVPQVVRGPLVRVVI